MTTNPLSRGRSGRATSSIAEQDEDCGIDPPDLTLVYLNALRNAGMSCTSLAGTRAHSAVESAVRGCSWPDMWAAGHYRAAAVLRRAWKRSPAPLARAIVAVLADQSRLSRIDAEIQTWVNNHSLVPITVPTITNKERSS